MNEYPKEQAQTSSRVLMIRPTGFGRDEEAAASNAFMRSTDDQASTIATTAQREFDGLVGVLRSAGVDVLVFEDDLALPDSVFPNNWVSFHQPTEGEPVLITYPMCTAARRKERRNEVLDAIADHLRIEPDHLDLSAMEMDGEILEGTGSLVLDRINGVAYACLSARTTEGALDAWADETGYRVVGFDAVDADGVAVYHTNVVMSMGSKVAVVCLEAIPDPDERAAVERELRASGRAVLELSLAQMGSFCGNMLELRTRDGSAVFAMSETCLNALSGSQRSTLEGLGRIVAAEIPTIERVGGGSVRCMIAELGNP
ncbi:MAG: hypothetical protein KC996_09450 [Phycisphaerales bacterium]|nr:hypothetical protein [Phycisphaerales bacterium]